MIIIMVAAGAKQTKRVIEMMLLYLLPFIFLKNDIMTL